MSCKETDRPDVLVYLRRTNGGDTAIYSWDYYLMSSLPTNDNVRYSRPENYTLDKNNTPLHEIGNNRYEDVVCKSTHLAYRVGGFSKRTAIPTGEAKNLVDKKYETDANQCVLLFTSSSSFYQRLPECLPWSCRRWTREIKARKDKNGNFILDKDGKKILDSDLIYKEDTDGNKIYVGDASSEYLSDLVPNLHIGYFIPFLNDHPVYTETINEMGEDYSDIYSDTRKDVSSDQNPNLHFDGYLFTRRVKYQDPISDEELKQCGCDEETKEISLALEIFPVLCSGTCSLIIKFGYICQKSKTDAKTNASNYTSGKMVKRVIKPFYSCNIEEVEEYSIHLIDPDANTEQPNFNNVLPNIIESVGIRLVESFADLFNLNNTEINLPYYNRILQTGQNYDVRVTDDKKNLYYYYWNLSDPPRHAVDYFTYDGSESIGKAKQFLNAQSSCCKKCKKVDPETKKITYFDNPLCYELDKECDGLSYNPDIKIDGSC